MLTWVGIDTLFSNVKWILRYIFSCKCFVIVYDSKLLYFSFIYSVFLYRPSINLFATQSNNSISFSCILFYSILLYSILVYSTLFHSTLPFSTLQYSTLFYFILPYCCLFYLTLLSSTLLYSTLLYCTLRYTIVLYFTLLYSSLLCFTLIYSTVLYNIVTNIYLTILHTKWYTGAIRRENIKIELFLGCKTQRKKQPNEENI